MKKLLAALTLALLVSLALAVSAANATHSEGEGPNHDFVSGTGQFQGLLAIDLEIHVNAKSGPSGEDAQGHFFIRQQPGFVFTELDIRGEVTCLNVQGNRATVGGEITESKVDPTFEGLGVLVYVEDRGEGNEPNDGSLIAFFTATPPEECHAPIPIPLLFEQGNYIVHDATP
jgi:hypothetical protein